MAAGRVTRATWIALAIAALAFGIAMLAHSAEQNDTEIVAVPLDPANPERTRIGELEYLGGLEIPPMGLDIGALSGLRWDEERHLVALTDDARFVSMIPVEEDGRLVGLAGVEVTPLRGLDGEILTGKERGDSESLTRSAQGGWLVGFERDHRVLTYDRGLHRLPSASETDAAQWLGPLENNGGLEAIASIGDTQIFCAERMADLSRTNCAIRRGDRPLTNFSVEPPRELAELGGVPTDADSLGDSAFVILFRSWSPSDGNSAAIVMRGLDGEQTSLASLQPPLTTDNFEGLAVREEAGRTFLYIVSDNNFSSSQRTLLMKFEVVRRDGTGRPPRPGGTLSR